MGTTTVTGGDKKGVGAAGAAAGGKRGTSVVAAAAATSSATGGPKINLPTWITIVRVVAVPVVTGLFYYPAKWVSPVICFIFVMAAVTDWLDGEVTSMHTHSPFPFVYVIRSLVDDFQ